MERYTVRIELHDADEKDYERLHEEMDALGFVRTIENKSGTTFHLPPAEYSYRGVEDIDTVLTLAKAAAGTVRPLLTPAVLVTQVKNRKFSGLAKVTATPTRR